MIKVEAPPKMPWILDDLDLEDDVNRRFIELFQIELHNAWASFLSTDAGRMIAWSILDKCHVFSSTYTGNAASNFLEGERSVGLKLLKQHILPFGPGSLSQMMEEADDRFDRLMAIATAQIEGETDAD